MLLDEAGGGGGGEITGKGVKEDLRRGGKGGGPKSGKKEKIVPKSHELYNPAAGEKTHIKRPPTSHGARNSSHSF